LGNQWGMARFDCIAVYIMASGRYGAIYTGVTSDLVTRVGQHRAGEGCAFTRRYNCTLLVWYEVHHDMRVAIQREHSMKRYLRQWKINLIEAENPGWNDLWATIRPGPKPGEWRSIDEIRRGKGIDPSQDSPPRTNRDPRDKPEGDAGDAAE
jgi:putative endonuclease